MLQNNMKYFSLMPNPSNSPKFGVVANLEKSLYYYSKMNISIVYLFQNNYETHKITRIYIHIHKSHKNKQGKSTKWRNN